MDINLDSDNYKSNMDLVKTFYIIDKEIDIKDRKDLRNREKTKWSCYNRT